MAQDRLIKGRIKSTKNIAQITRAMQMVSASKMKKATELALSGRPYAEKIFEMTATFVRGIDTTVHPLLKKEGSGTIAVVLISTNKGLCGGLNSNLFRKVIEWFPKDQKIQVITVGKKGRVFSVRTARVLVADFSETNFFTKMIAPVAKLVTEGFINNTYSHVYLVYNNFISALSQVPTMKQLLPIGTLAEDKERESSASLQMVVEPSIEEVLDALLVSYIENQIRDAILEAEASEHSARMIAMKNATDNAQSLAELLTLEYNKARQQKITFEIADMVTARMAVGE